MSNKSVEATTGDLVGRERKLNKQLSVGERVVSPFVQIYREISLFLRWLHQRFCQTLLIISSVFSYAFLRITAHPHGTLSTVIGLWTSEQSHIIFLSQLYLNGIIYLLNGLSMKKMYLRSKFTWVLFYTNLFLGLMHLRNVKHMFGAVYSFRDAFVTQGLPEAAAFFTANKSIKPSLLRSILMSVLIPVYTRQLSQRLQLEKQGIRKETYANIDHFEGLETKPYLDMEKVDPKLFAAIAINPTLFESQINLMGFRGPRHSWHDLDIYRNEHMLKYLRHRRKGAFTGFPVFLYIHGGGWVVCDKSFGLAGTLDHLSENFNIIVVKANYRMAPERTLRQQLLDVKRAIGWVKMNIHIYGGNPNQICLGGESAGGHLTLLSNMTNDPDKYATLFDDVPESEITPKEYKEVAEMSSVPLLVDIAAAHDLTNNETVYMPNASSLGSNTAILTQATLRKNLQHELEHFHLVSPLHILKNAIANKTNLNLSPVLFTHGDRDGMTSIRDSKETFALLEHYRFSVGDNVYEVDQGKATIEKRKRDIYVEIPTAHHGAGYFKSPRAAVMSASIAGFMNAYFGTVKEAIEVNKHQGSIIKKAPANDSNL